MTKKKSINPDPTLLIKVFVLTAVVSLPLGFAVGNSTADKTSEVAESSEVAVDKVVPKTHEHNTFEVDAEGAPAITGISVIKDPKAGWNLSFETSGFIFTPENASTDHVANEGHAHVYVDGEKITRLYGSDFYLGELGEGEHDISVTLNTNDHKDYAVDGKVIEARQTIVDDHHADDDHDTTPHSHN